MPRKNKTAYNRRKCERSRSQRRRRNSNRRTRNIRGGGWRWRSPQRTFREWREGRAAESAARRDRTNAAYLPATLRSPLRMWEDRKMNRVAPTQVAPAHSPPTSRRPAHAAAAADGASRNLNYRTDAAAAVAAPSRTTATNPNSGINAIRDQAIASAAEAAAAAAAFRSSAKTRVATAANGYPAAPAPATAANGYYTPATATAAPAPATAASDYTPPATDQLKELDDAHAIFKDVIYNIQQKEVGKLPAPGNKQVPIEPRDELNNDKKDFLLQLTTATDESVHIKWAAAQLVNCQWGPERNRNFNKMVGYIFIGDILNKDTMVRWVTIKLNENFKFYTLYPNGTRSDPIIRGANNILTSYIAECNSNDKDQSYTGFIKLFEIFSTLRREYYCAYEVKIILESSEPEMLLLDLVGSSYLTKKCKSAVNSILNPPSFSPMFLMLNRILSELTPATIKRINAMITTEFPDDWPTFPSNYYPTGNSVLDLLFKFGAFYNRVI